jgi:DNA (cytosine-5)-methyltransferase 1
MDKLRVLDLFSGIGGFSLGLERTGGFETVAFCEIEPFPRRVLAKHWPEVPCYDDVRTLTADILERDGIAVDVITGGFPCQDLSTAGRQAGMGEGTRSGLWSEIVRLISELRPRYVIVENVANLLSGPSQKRGGWFGRVLGDLAECGYDAEWENIPAAAVGAPHRRERVWIIAYPNRDGLEAKPAKEILFDQAGDSRLPRRLGEMDSPKIWAEPRPIGAVPMALGDGLPEWLGDIKGAGNAVVPQIPELIGRAILQAEATQ